MISLPGFLFPLGNGWLNGRINGVIGNWNVLKWAIILSFRLTDLSGVEGKDTYVKCVFRSFPAAEVFADYGAT